MNTIKLKKQTVNLKNFSRDITKDEREFIDAEKKYYRLVVTLRKNRERLGFTQEKLAHLSHIPRTTITKIESGSRNATLQTLMSIAQAMGKKIELKLA